MKLLKIDLPYKIHKPVLAVGADMKSSPCLAYGRSVFVSQTINDLQQPENFHKFQKTIALLVRRIKRQPRIIAYDPHPEYFSTKYILSLAGIKDKRLIPVQHHHAHIASCMLENGLPNQKVIGVVFDGTGLGSDNTIWGAEFLIADYRRFSRAAHLRYIPLLGGQAAILQPWRIAAAWLYLTFGNNFLNLNFAKRINRRDWKTLKKMWEQNFNAPPASSMGRLFDAVAAFLLGIYQVKSEAEAAISLERVASGYKSPAGSYRFKIQKKAGSFIIDPVLLFKDIALDLKKGRSKEEIAACFHSTVARMIKNTCLKIRGKTGINRVVLSGGVFQNKILFKQSLNLLEKEKFWVITHKILSCSDAGISPGQAAIAS
jgi:hydrogenase maturation protein HypF